MKNHIQSLKDRGFKVTKARQGLLSLLQKTNKALSPQEICDQLSRQKQLKDLNLSSVYRNLEALEAQGILHRTAQSQYVGCRQDSSEGHVHVLLECHNCGDVDEKILSEKSQKALTSDHILSSQGVGVLHLERTCQLCQ